MKPKPIKKLYYSISEVSKLTHLKQYVLRYWETEFNELRPAKNRAGNRIYRLNDIKLIFLIKKLLYEDKYTIEGARQKLKDTYRNEAAQANMPFLEQSREALIEEIKSDLQEVLDILKDSSPDNGSNDSVQQTASENVPQPINNGTPLDGEISA